jgi:hypothetical protein
VWSAIWSEGIEFGVRFSPSPRERSSGSLISVGDLALEGKREVRAPIFDSCGSPMAVGDTAREMTEEVRVVVFNRCGSLMSVYVLVVC